MGVSVQSLRSCSVLANISSVAALLFCIGEGQLLRSCSVLANISSVAALLFCIANYRLQSPATITAPKSLRWRFQ